MSINTNTIERPELAVDIILPVKANAVIEAGEFVVCVIGEGYAREGDTLNGSYMGIAQESVDATGLSDGDLKIRVKRPRIFKALSFLVAPNVINIGSFALLHGKTNIDVETDLTAAAASLQKYIGKIVGIDENTGQYVISAGF